MSRGSDLESAWAGVRALLEEACRLLPGDADVTLYDDYAAHNELELALDSLGDVGEALRGPPRFWSLLERAAGSMDLGVCGPVNAFAGAASKPNVDTCVHV